jgi:cell division protein FtsL
VRTRAALLETKPSSMHRRAPARPKSSKAEPRRPAKLRGRPATPAKSSRGGASRPAGGTPKPTGNRRAKTSLAPKPRGRQRRSRLRVVRPATRSNRGRVVFLMLSFLLVGLLVVGVVTVQALVSQSSFRMEKLQKENTALEASYGELRLRVAELSSPDRIAKEARRLGLRLPGEVQTLYVAGVPDERRETGSPDHPSFALKGALAENP